MRIAELLSSPLSKSSINFPPCNYYRQIKPFTLIFVAAITATHLIIGTPLFPTSTIRPYIPYNDSYVRCGPNTSASGIAGNRSHALSREPNEGQDRWGEYNETNLDFAVIGFPKTGEKNITLTREIVFLENIRA